MSIMILTNQVLLSFLIIQLYSHEGLRFLAYQRKAFHNKVHPVRRNDRTKGQWSHHTQNRNVTYIGSTTFYCNRGFFQWLCYMWDSPWGLYSGSSYHWISVPYCSRRLHGAWYCGHIEHLTSFSHKSLWITIGIFRHRHEAHPNMFVLDLQSFYKQQIGHG